MAILSAALVVAAIAGAFVAGGALDRGYPMEVSLVRGALAFMAVSFAGYLGELVVVTAPRRMRERQAPPTAHADEPGEPRALPSPPQLMAPPSPATELVDEDDADVDVRRAA